MPRKLGKSRRFRKATAIKEASLFLSPLLAAGAPSLRADFLARIPGITTSTDKEETLARLKPSHDAAARALGFEQIHLAEQIHGANFGVITHESPLTTQGVDGLLTNEPGILLGIQVADCGAVYLLDSQTGALALLHSGKKGTEKNILGAVVKKMQQEFGTNPEHLHSVLSPCIRPPYYEIDFASHLRQQALESGIPARQFHDCGLCTGADPKRFYSYRLEKGNTGRMLALLGKIPS